MGSQVRSQVPSFVYPYLNNSFWVGYYGYYEFINKELGLKFDRQKEWDLLVSLKDMSWMYPFKDFCVMSEKPIEINMKNGLLHAEGKPSVKYADGFSCWSLNGVAVTQYLAETPAKELDIEFFKKEKNADVKAEFVRKYGIDKMLNLGTKMDDYTKYKHPLWNKSKYELWDMKSIFEGVTKHNRCPHLKMLNPSTQQWHVEAVHPECKNLEEALKWRMNNHHTELLTIK